MPGKNEAFERACLGGQGRWIFTEAWSLAVMAGLVPAIHVLLLRKDVDARHKAGHDEACTAPIWIKR